MSAPRYRVYRSRRRPLDRLRNRDIASLSRPGKVGGGRPWWKWVLIGVGAWIMLSIVAFEISAQIARVELPDTGDTLGGGLNMVTHPETILVIGGDKRGDLHSGDETAASNEPLADSIMLIRAGGGVFRKLSIPRDTVAEIPGYGQDKINSAYEHVGLDSKLGDVELMTRTVEDFLDIKVDHVIVVSFDGFVHFVNAIGGAEVDLDEQVCGVLAGGRENGGQSIRIGPGTHTLNGDQALLLSRIRKNSCQPDERDPDRARHQQLVLTGIRNRLTDLARLPLNFIKAPLIAWTAPQAIASDMGPVTMAQLAVATLVGADDQTSVLEPSGFGAGDSLVVPEAERQQKVEEFLDGG